MEPDRTRAPYQLPWQLLLLGAVLAVGVLSIAAKLLGLI